MPVYYGSTAFPVIHDSSCLLGAFNALCACARNYYEELNGDTVEIDKQIETVKAALASQPVLTSLRDRLPGPDDVAPHPANSKVVMVASGVDTDPWCWVAKRTTCGWLFKPATIQWITIKRLRNYTSAQRAKIEMIGFNSRISYTHWVPAAAFPLPTYCPEVSDAD